MSKVGHTIAALTLCSGLTYAHTDLEDDWIDIPTTQRYELQERSNLSQQLSQQYAAHTECEVHNYTSSPSAAQQVPALPQKQSLLERLSEVLKDDCGKVRVDKNEIICEDTVRCTKQETIGKEYDAPNAICVEYYCPTSTTSCIQWQMRERWRFNPTAVGKMEALLIDTQKIEDLQPFLFLGYALRPVGKNELYLFKMESTTRQIKNIINYEKP